YFFFQAEDGIRGFHVTGVQTCALPIFVGDHVIEQLEQLAEPFRGKRFVHVNSTRVGGGVAEILDKMVPLMRELGIDATWEVITRSEERRVGKEGGVSDVR